MCKPLKKVSRIERCSPKTDIWPINASDLFEFLKSPWGAPTNKDLSSMKHASTVGGAFRAGAVSTLLPGSYGALVCENVSSDRWYNGEKGDQKASKSDHPRGQKRPTMGLKAWLRAWLRWRTPFYHRARRSGPPFSTTNQTSRTFSSRGPSPHLSAPAWCWHNQSVEYQPVTVKWTTVKQGDRQTVVAE